MKYVFICIGVVVGIIGHMLYIGLSLPYNKKLREDLKAAIKISEEP